MSPDNGILLATHVHRLFENGLLSFGDDAVLKTRLDPERLAAFGLRPDMKLACSLSSVQRGWMKRHRKTYGYED
ncbi:HNH endonuclease signature motif containing protein [Bradyrhizobium japonicum]|uniref:HNH endonuclease signature motif containing protein n=1 Tax=Bradyrhizobium japonicum TaxID=375 RepID=UPI003D22E923